MIGIYIHIPFCVRKCLYCDFASYVRTDEMKTAYVDRLVQEIGAFETTECVDTVFIGGGTPSILPAEEMERILKALKAKFSFSDNVECTIEVNPGTVDSFKLEEYYRMGINRLSIGLQSCDNQELKALGRIHTYEDFETTYFAALKAGFANINVDLMSAIPYQTVESFRESLHKVIALGPQHISAYSLIVEEGTPFSQMQLPLPDEESEREMYYEAKRILLANGYERYEISNYAKKGFSCRHNVGYWTGKEYVGFGVAAASFYKGVRSSCATDVERYIEHGPWLEERIMLTEEDKMSEYFFVGLRMMKGVSEGEFLEKFGVVPRVVFGDALDKHMKNGLLVKEDGRIRLTEKGIDVSNYVLCDFVL